MRVLIFIILLLHGLIHLMGFVKAYFPNSIAQFSQDISKLNGVFWLITTAFFIIAAILFIWRNEIWLIFSIVAVLLSQYLIFISWQDAKFGIVANIIILLVIIIGFGKWQFHHKYVKDIKSGFQQDQKVDLNLLTENDIAGMPLPIQKYLHYTRSVGKPKVKNFKIDFTGKIRQNEALPWMDFTAEQYSFVHYPTRLFFLNATMKNLPVAGYHAYKNKNAFMDIRLLSLVPVQYQEGNEMNMAETVTFFNDMCIMAPASLVDPRIKWLKVEGNKVEAEFTNDDISIRATLYFNEDGALTDFISNDRYALQDNGTMIQVPWSTPVSDYEEMNGYYLASTGDAIYQYPDRQLKYGTFFMKNITYNLQNQY